MKIGTIATSSNFFAYTALTKPASEKIVAPSSTVDSVTSGCGMRTLVNSNAMHSTMTPNLNPRRTAPATYPPRITQLSTWLTSSSQTGRQNLSTKKTQEK